MSENPYAPPQASEHGRSPTTTHSFVDWERLRLRYNFVVVIFIFFATGMAWPGLLIESKFWSSSVFVALVSNGVYTLGHLFGTLLTPYFREQKRLRVALFAAFSFLALVIANATVAAEMFPGI